jgi:TPR repeat protein
MKHRVKRFVLRYYPLFCVTSFFGVIALLILRVLEWQSFAIIVGGIGAFAFGVQRQNHEETKLFKELFEQFNARYHALNDDLNQIFHSPDNLPLNETEIKTLFEYFNLSGEEYLYFEMGYIPQEVWQSWENGMRFFRQNARIRKLWDDDLTQGSYYGFSFVNDEIKNSCSVCSLWNRLKTHFGVCHIGVLALISLSSALQIHAQPSEADRKLLAEIRNEAEKGDAQSEFEVGTAFYVGKLGVAKDAVEAVKWFRKAVEQNHGQAQLSLGVCYAVGEGVADDEVEAVKWWRKAAEHNLAWAQLFLGESYAEGKGVEKDESHAVKWYRKAAEQNLAGAQYELGVCYSKGTGVAKDEPEAVKWYRKAADQNDAAAQYNLGLCYGFGGGVAKDEVEAVNWYRKAAGQNYPKAHRRLGLCYATGTGVAKDEVEAVKWFRKAAEENNASAQYLLGWCYAGSHGVAKDEMEAVRWYRKAAEQNNAQAQSELGACYFGGRGVAKDYVEAYKWRLLAAAQGNEIAKKAVSALESSFMTREQIADGQKLARNFEPREVPDAGSDSSSAKIAQTRPEASGSGFFITADGYLITNQHVAGNGAQIRLVTSGGLISAQVLKVDAANDLALLKAEGRFAALPVAASRGVKLGGTVATVGFPNIGLQGFAPKLAKGEIASLSGAGDDARYFQISVPVQPGNSGGALVDERGNVVGVVSAKLSAVAALQTSGALPENVNYAIKSSYLLSFLESVPGVEAKLKPPNTKEKKFEDVVKEAEQAAVLVLVY